MFVCSVSMSVCLCECVYMSLLCRYGSIYLHKHSGLFKVDTCACIFI